MKRMKNILIALLLALLALPLTGQVRGKCGSVKLYSGQEKAKLISRQARLHENALRFIGKPYVGGVLEKEPERLVVEPDSVDCLTFVEYALALTFADEEGGFVSSIKENLQQIRYRYNKIDDYTDRLHYTLDWKLENCKYLRLTDITAQCPGAVETKKKIDFMSTHAASYKQLSKNPQFIDEIRVIEERLSQTPFYYIPTEAIGLRPSVILPGDIILFTTTIAGLDIAHLGIVTTDEKGNFTFIHASSDAGKVIVNPEPLADYCKKMKRVSGIIVLRINESE